VLVELICVVAIIAILASILFPAFARARQRARAVSCMNNLQQIGMALRFYAEDHGGRFPPTNDDFSPLYPRYIATDATFECPSMMSSGAGTGVPATSTGGIVSTYIYLAGRTLRDRGDTALAADSSPYTHNDTANVLFLSGRTKTVLPSEWTAYGLPGPVIPPPGGEVP
jgi:type II secretory pathway pseudopilin PulG